MRRTGERIQKLMSEIGITRLVLREMTGIIPKRLADILDTSLEPSGQELATIAIALEVHKEELQCDGALWFAKFLKSEGEYRYFPELYPIVAAQTQREKEDLGPEDQRFTNFCVEILAAHRAEHRSFRIPYFPPPWA